GLRQLPLANHFAGKIVLHAHFTQLDYGLKQICGRAGRTLFLNKLRAFTDSLDGIVPICWFGGNKVAISQGNRKATFSLLDYRQRACAVFSASFSFGAGYVLFDWIRLGFSLLIQETVDDLIDFLNGGTQLAERRPIAAVFQFAEFLQ